MFLLEVADVEKLYFTSDLHFGHYNICRFCNRPFLSRKEMDDTLIQNWNSVVPEDGIVICCGDLTLAHKPNYKEYWYYIKKLNGLIYLTRGNHDIIPLGDYFDLNDETQQKLKLSVHDKMLVKTNDALIYAEHYPCLAFNGDYQVFGHIHTLANGKCYGKDAPVIDKLSNNQYDVGVDQNNYRPISYADLADIFQKRLA